MDIPSFCGGSSRQHQVLALTIDGSATGGHFGYETRLPGSSFFTSREQFVQPTSRELNYRTSQRRRLKNVHTCKDFLTNFWQGKASSECIPLKVFQVNG